MRDALNLLEQTRFAAAVVTRTSVSAVVGHLEDSQVFSLFQAILAGQTKTSLMFLKDFAAKNIAADVVWHALCAVAHTSLLVQYELPLGYFHEYKVALEKSIAEYSAEKIHSFLTVLYENEQLFSKMRNQYLFLELLVMRFSARKQSILLSTVDSEPCSEMPQHDVVSKQIPETTVQPFDQQKVNASVTIDERWNIFVESITQLNDPLLSSVFKQIHTLAFDETAHVLTLTFSKDFIFFNEWLENTHASWQPLLKKVFGNQAVCKPVFIALAADQTSALVRAQPEQARVQAEQKNSKPSIPVRSTPSSTYSYNVRKQVPKQAPSFDVSEASTWKNAALILQYFPGTVHEVKESSHE